MSIYDFNKQPRSFRDAKRVGRGKSSGHGKTCGRGHKGQKSRSGVSRLKLYFKTGQITVGRSLPKRGFNSHAQRFRRPCRSLHIDLVNAIIQKYSLGNDVKKSDLLNAGFIKSMKESVKLLMGKKNEKAFSIEVDFISSSAKSFIESAGFKVSIIES